MNIIPKKGRKMFYASDVDARFGFPALSAIAKDQGAEIDKGDIVIFDNPNLNRRKALVKAPRGIMLIHVKLTNKNSYAPLSEIDGLIRKRKNTLN